MQRRGFVGTALAAIIAGLSARVSAKPASPPQPDPRARAIEAELASLEKGVGARLGVAIHDIETGLVAGHRANERFPMCSTFKLMLAASVLARVDRREDSLARRIVFGDDRLDSYAPVTRAHTGAPGMTLAELCDAAVTMSDNTAANILLDTIGGPPGFTAYMRRLGDTVTRLDRTEPALNTAIAGDPRDTTTPLAMLGSLRNVLLGDALSPASRVQLLAWAMGNRVGDARLRAGVPRDWRVGDKTGTGAHGTANDVGILWPQERAPILVAVYLTGTQAPDSARDAAIADVARGIVRHLA